MRNKIFINSIILFLSLFIVFVSCGKQDAEWKGAIEEGDGATVVKNPKEPMYPENVFNLEEELSIGEADGPEEYMFSQARDLAISEDERIFVLDSKEHHIKVFNKDGKYLKTIGKPGQGPGELNRPRSISIAQNELAVLEGTRHFSFFSLDGDFLRRISTKETWAMRARVDSRGNIIAEAGVVDPEYFHYKVSKFDSNMNLLTEITTSPAPDSRKAINPFMPVSWWVIDKNDNIVYGYPKEYEIQIYNPEGKLMKKIEKKYDPIEITEEEKKERIEGWAQGTRLAFSKFHSAFIRFTVDDEGRIFIQTWKKINDGEGYYYDVFCPDGKFLAKIPLKIQPRIWKEGKLYTIEEDEGGYHVVKSYKVTWNIM